MPRTMRVYGCFGYNDSPEDLGEPSGFWRFDNYAALWRAFEISEELNQAFDQLGLHPTTSVGLAYRSRVFGLHSLLSW